MRDLNLLLPFESAFDHAKEIRMRYGKLCWNNMTETKKRQVEAYLGKESAEAVMDREMSDDQIWSGYDKG